MVADPRAVCGLMVTVDPEETLTTSKVGVPTPPLVFSMSSAALLAS
jgi:hypothetical protein